MKDQTERLRKLAKQRSGRWYDDVEFEILAFLDGTYLVNIRNHQGNHTSHYAAQLREFLEEKAPDIQVTVKFLGPVWLEPTLWEIGENNYWATQKREPSPPPARPRAPWRLE